MRLQELILTPARYHSGVQPPERLGAGAARGFGPGAGSRSAATCRAVAASFKLEGSQRWVGRSGSPEAPRGQEGGGDAVRLARIPAGFPAVAASARLPAQRQTPGHIARRLTQELASADSWLELAEVVATHGVAALNEIHLAAALTRLAKLDLSRPAPEDTPGIYGASSVSRTSPTAQPQTPGRAPTELGLTTQPSSRPLPASIALSAPPFSLSHCGPQLYGPAVLGATGAVPLVPSLAPLSPLAGGRLGLASQAPNPASPHRPVTSSSSGPTDSTRHGSYVTAASPAELFVQLLTTLTGPLSDPPPPPPPPPLPAPSQRQRKWQPSAAGASGAPAAVLPARVLANAGWAASRLYQQLWPPSASGEVSLTSALAAGGSAAYAGSNAGLGRKELGAAPQERRHAAKALRALFGAVPAVAGVSGTGFRTCPLVKALLAVLNTRRPVCLVSLPCPLPCPMPHQTPWSRSTSPTCYTRSPLSASTSQACSLLRRKARQEGRHKGRQERRQAGRRRLFPSWAAAGRWRVRPWRR
jgi:hypothetical protein